MKLKLKIYDGTLSFDHTQEFPDEPYLKDWLENLTTDELMSGVHDIEVEVTVEWQGDDGPVLLGPKEVVA